MSKAKPRTAVYTGSFDPITLGHLNVIERAADLVDKLFVGVGINTGKAPLFTIDERVDLVKKAVKHLANVEVRKFDGLAVTFVRDCGARVMVRGVRPLQDVEAEFTMMLANRQLDAGIETVLLMADKEFAHVSSSLIKQIAPLAGDAELAHFVPNVVITELRSKMKKNSPEGKPTPEKKKSK
ncbi:MAG: pantetheine-phosphate adenylyltransferase [Planctomycetia bacterium]|nr:pantetheine-phosphate adenylyltransferase [Planctomycetia bacterium]